jgi:hypothetical protein
MPNRILRALLIVEFLLAVQVLSSFWAEVGGQYHLELMFWGWKLGLNLLAAALIVAITACVARAESSLPRRLWIYAGLLLATLAVAGLVTYYYHLNEPSDDQDDGQQDQPATQSTTADVLPDPARLLAAHHGLTGFAAERRLELGHI